MFQLGTVTFTIIDLTLTGTLVLLALTTLLALRRIAQLESRLNQHQRFTAREIKMVNQGAIGIGRRFASIEKDLKKSDKVAIFEEARAIAEAKNHIQQMAEPAQPEAPEKTSGSGTELRSTRRTRAEQALSAWLNDHQTA